MVPKAQLTGRWDRKGLLVPAFPTLPMIHGLFTQHQGARSPLPIGSLAPNPPWHREEDASLELVPPGG